MRCLVTGASGFLGRHLCQRLMREGGVSIRAIGRSTNLPFPGGQVEYLQCDLASVPSRASEILADIDVVFHLAGMAHNKADDAQLWQVNVEQSCALMDAALAQGVSSFVYVSSSKAQQEPGDALADEKAPPVDKNDSYGYSKWCAEQHLLSLEGFAHRTILRPCLIYGSGVQGNLASLIQAARRGFLPALPDSGARRSMVSADDVAEALWLASQQPAANAEIFLLADNEAYSACRLVESIYSALGRKAPIRVPAFLLRWLAYAGELVCRVSGKSFFTLADYHKLLGPAQYSNRKAKRLLAWQPAQTFEAVLPLMLSETNTNGQGESS